MIINQICPLQRLGQALCLPPRMLCLERKSFNDTGFGPVLARWKGACEEGKDFKATSCNRKLIGAQFFSKGYEASMGPIDETRESRSPRDNDGHETHEP